MNARTEHDEVAMVRKPPHSVEAEQSLLGGLLLDNGAFDRVGDLLTEADFYRFEHRAIWAATATLISANKTADVVTVFEKLREAGKAGEVGGLPYLNAMAQSVPSAANARRYAEIVRKRSLERSMVAAADEAATLAYNGEEDVAEKLQKISALFTGLERGVMRKGPATLESLIVRAVDRYSDLAEGKAPKAFATGIAPLDRLLVGRGIEPGKVYGIAARPSVGKSAIARSIGIKTAEQGHQTLLLSQEMGGDELTDCIVAQLGGIDNDALQTGQLDDADWGRLTEACDIASKLPLHIDDQGALTLADIRAKARQVKGLKVLILDYLQLSVSTLKGANRNDQVGEISRGLKALAMQMGVAVVLLSQLNREVEKRVDKEPRLSDLRDSGEIEQDLDVALLLWTAKEFEGQPRRIVGASLAKQRGGKRGRFALEFHANVYRWYESAYNLNGPTRTEAAGGFE